MISIIVPVYQTENYIEKCMQSLCNQTCREFEVILVDDGTKDSSMIKAEKILKNGKIHYSICAEKDSEGNSINRGLACARNLGIKNAIGEWILCIDSDDYIHPKTIEIFSCEIEKNNTQLIICDYKNVVEEFSIEEYLCQDEKNYKREIISRKVLLQAFFERKMRVVIPTILVKKSFLEKYQIEYPSNSRYSEDQIYLWKVFLCSDFAILIHKKLYFYVHRANSISTGSSLNQIISGYESGRKAFEEFRTFVTENLYKEDVEIDYDKIVGRWILGLSHSSAMLLDYKDFCALLNSMEYKSEVVKLLWNRDIKTILATALLLLNKRIFYKIAKRSMKKHYDADRE